MPVMATILAMLVSAAAFLGGGVVYRGAAGSGSYGNAGLTTVTADDRYLVFASAGGGLVAGDTNGAYDVFIEDRASGAVTRLSTDAAGGEADGDSKRPRVTPGGGLVVFQSDADNLVPGDTNGAVDIFVKDVATGAITLVSRAADGTQGDGDSTEATISADGRYVAFRSLADNLVPGDDNGEMDVFWRDLETGATMRVSAGAGGRGGGGGDLYGPWISADGRYVAFESAAADLVPGDTNGVYDIFVRDTQGGEIKRASTGAGGEQANEMSVYPSLSADGRYVLFRSIASNLVPGDDVECRYESAVYSCSDVFVKDTQTGEIRMVSTNAAGEQADASSFDPVISADGRYAAFSSTAGNLVPGTGGEIQVFRKDIAGGDVALASRTSRGAAGNDWSVTPYFSYDGAWLAFESLAGNLAPGDDNGVADAFLARNPGACNGLVDLVLAGTDGYWAGYEDYRGRLLSVDFHLAGAAGSRPALGVQLDDVQASGEVEPATPLPLSLGDVLGDWDATVFTLKYRVPEDVTAFTTTLHLSARDSCGVSYAWPPGEGD